MKQILQKQGVGWIWLAQQIKQRWGLVNAVINIPVPYKAFSLLISRTINCFSERALLDLLSYKEQSSSTRILSIWHQCLQFHPVSSNHTLIYTLESQHTFRRYSNICPSRSWLFSCRLKHNQPNKRHSETHKANLRITKYNQWQPVPSGMFYLAFSTSHCIPSNDRKTSKWLLVKHLIQWWRHRHSVPAFTWRD
jgi:hypothetical protein